MVLSRALFLWLVCPLASAWALDPALPPGRNVDLSAFKLQTLDADKRFLEVKADALQAGYSQPFFFTDAQDGAVVFAVPSDAATTRNTHYPRSELRQTGMASDWLLSDPRQHVLRVQMKVMQVAAAKPQTIIGQIHGTENESELLKLRWTGDQPGKCRIEARLQANDASRQEYGVVLARGLSLGDLLEFTLTMQEGVVTVSVNGETTTQRYTPEFYGRHDRYYFKTGNYLQYRGEPVVTGINKLYALSIDVR